MSLPIADFLADVATVSARNESSSTFGSGRLIAPGLILTAGHVVDFPTRQSPSKTGWKVCLLRDRVSNSSWQISKANRARLVWRGMDRLDLALLKIENDNGPELRPRLQPRFALLDRIGPIADVDATGFPDARITPGETVGDYTVPGILRIAGQFESYAWTVELAYKPDDPHGWKGMSGAGACRVEWNGALFLFGAVQEVPANFTSGQLHVARLCEAFRDAGFVNHLRASLGAEPELVRYELPPSQADLGIASIFRARIRAFKDEYLVSETTPVPFGGRDSELRRLDTWLLDPKGSPRMLVTAPAGRGKSALLVQWMKNLQDGGLCGADGWQLAFMPISIRIGTNRPAVYYEGLARRLAEIVGGTFPSETIGSGDGYAIREILDRTSGSERRILIVVDGLDEALHGSFDPAILPSPLPKHLRVVLSARWQLGDHDSQGWLNRLSWDRTTLVDRFELRPLDAAGIADVLAKLVAPADALARQRGLIERLVELTEGEPLLVRYYAEDLSKPTATSTDSSMAPIDLGSMKPGFYSYFKRWFDQQEQLWRDENTGCAPHVIDHVLSLLAFALGPLGQRDLRELMAYAYNTHGVIAPDGLLAPLRRFVTGDGKSGSGYILSHPRIGQYLQEERFAAIGPELRSSFAHWATAHLRGLNERRIGPEQASDYLLQFLAHHLHDTHAPPADYCMMLENGWRQAWETFEGAISGFAADVRTVRDVLADYARGHPERLREQIIGLGGQIRCALCLSSICSLNYDFPSPLLGLSIRTGVLSVRQALAMLAHDPLTSSRTEAFVDLIPYLSGDQFLGRVRQLVADLQATGNDPTHFISQVSVASDAEKKSALITLLPVLKDEKPRAVLIALCAPYVGTADLREAVAAARALRDPGRRSRALCWLALHSAPALPERQLLLAEAYSAAELVGEAELRALRIHTFAQAPASTAADAPSILDDLLLAIRDACLGAAIIAKAAARLSIDERTIIAAAALTSQLNQTETRPLIPLIALLPPNRLTDAIKVAQAIGDPTARVEFLAALVDRAIEVNSPAVSELVLALCDPETCPSGCAALSKLAAHISDGETCTVIAARIDAASATSTNLCKARTLAFLTCLRAEAAGPVSPARLLKRIRALTFNWRHRGGTHKGGVPDVDRYAFARDVDKRPGRAFVLSEITALLPPQTRSAVLHEALHAARSIPSRTSPEGRADALTAVARVMADSARDEVVAEAIEETCVVRDDLHKQRTLKNLAPLLSAPLAERALQVTATIKTVFLRAEVLKCFSPFIGKQELARAVRECLTAARRIDDSLARENTSLKLRSLICGEDKPAASDEAAGSGYRGSADPTEGPPSREFMRKARSLAEKVLQEVNAGPPGGTGWDGDEQWVGALLHSLRRSAEEEKPCFRNALLAVVREITPENSKRDILILMAPHLTPDSALEAWGIARAFRDSENRTEAFAQIVPRLPETGYASAMAELLAAAPQLRRPQLLAALAAAASVIHAVGGDAAIRETARAISAVGDWWP